MSGICTCCGQVLPPAGLSVDLNTSRLLYQGKVIRLAPQLADFLSMLVTHAGKPVTMDRLAAGLWGANGVPSSKTNVLRVYISRGRNILRPLGYDIFTAGRGRGTEPTVTLARRAAEQKE